MRSLVLERGQSTCFLRFGAGGASSDPSCDRIIQPAKILEPRPAANDTEEDVVSRVVGEQDWAAQTKRSG